MIIIKSVWPIFNCLNNIICNSDSIIYLVKDYNDLYDNCHTIKEYLYSMTNNVIRNFFGIEEKKTNSVNDLVTKKPGILSRIKTRVF